MNGQKAIREIEQSYYQMGRDQENRIAAGKTELTVAMIFLMGDNWKVFKKQYLLLAAMVAVSCCLVFCSEDKEETAVQQEDYIAWVPSPEVTPEEYSVYSDLIEAMFPDKYELFVIRDRTSSEDSATSETLPFQYLHSHMPSLSPETFANFQAMNDKEYNLQRHFQLETDYILLGAEENEEIFSAVGPWVDPWDEFYERYPNSQGIMTLSRVGFDDNMNQALVYLGNVFGGLGGQGNCILLTKVSGVWVIESDVFLWTA